jgi:hypothetical protein
MATINYPSGTHHLPSRFEAELRGSVLVSVSPLTGSVSTLEIPGARWVFRLGYDPAYFGEQAEREALWSAVRGQANRLALYHFARPAPRGTMRGSPTLGATAAAGATTINISGSGTLLAGDMLGIGGQLVQVVANTSSLSSTQIQPAIRTSRSGGTPVVWDKPTSTFLLMTPGVSVPYGPALGDAFEVELMEAWT